MEKLNSICKNIYANYDLISKLQHSHDFLCLNLMKYMY